MKKFKSFLTRNKGYEKVQGDDGRTLTPQQQQFDAYNQQAIEKKRLGIIIFQLVAGVVYIGSQLSLSPPSRLALLTNTTSLDNFPNSYFFAVDGVVVTVLLTLWLLYAFQNYKNSKNISEVIFDDVVPKHAYLLPVGMLLTVITGQMLPFAGDVNPWIGVAFSFATDAILLYCVLSTMPEIMVKNVIDLDIKVRMQVKTLPSWVAFGQLCLSFFWLLKAIDMYTPPDLSAVMNEQSATPIPTGFHQKTSSQNVGAAFVVLVSILVMFFG